MAQYEYKISERTKLDQERLNKYGIEGWEIVSIIINPSSDGDFMYYDIVFKRKLS